ncbi:MAG: hypothetical protein ACF8QF_05620 [Phycisphaerales bacterium]
MLISRKIGKLVRGKATPFQIISASVLGAMLGFISFDGPDLLARVTLTTAVALVLVVLNANLFLAGLVGLGAKLVSLFVMPVTFAAGRVLLDGPTQPFFEWAINTPVLALMGLEYYSLTGALVMGLILGLIVGVSLSAAIRQFRRTMAKMEEGSDRYQRYTAKGWVKALTWIFLGKGHGKKTSYAELAEKRMGNPVRPLGVVFALLVVGLGFIAQLFLTEPLVTAAVQRGLERANGATVDLASADLDLSQGTMTLTGLAMADPNALSTNLLAAQQVEINVATSDLLRKRMAFDRIVVNEASQGGQRRFPGRIIGQPPKPAPAPEGPGKTIEDYFKQAEIWQERLAQARRWLEKISRPDPDAAPEEGQPRETLEERLKREVAQQGFSRVRATHLIEGAPLVVVRELEIDGVVFADLPDDPLSIRGVNLSTQPWLLSEAGNLNVTSRSGALTGAFTIEPSGAARLTASRTGLSADAISDMLIADPLSGGTVDLSLDAALSGATLQAPLTVTARNTTLSLPQVGSTDVDQFTLPIALFGPVDAPRIVIDDAALRKALVDAGANELLGELQDKLGDEIGDKLPSDAQNIIGNILGGNKKKPAEQQKPPMPNE